MTENLPDTNVGNIEYIRKQDAVDALPKPQICEYMDEFGAGRNSYAYDAEKAIEAILAADVISKADMITLLEQTEKELVKDIDKYSIAYNFIVSVMGIIKCKINMMGEKTDD